MRNKNFVFDTNTLISAFIFRNSNPRLAFEFGVREGEVFSSFETFTELEEVLFRSKFDKYIPLNDKKIAFKEFKELARFVNITETITACRDPKDNKFLELAVSANASCIITGDKDLLSLHPFRGIPIVSAADFLNMTF